jgi:membrane protein DedA with SNARE-associated domain
MNVETIIQLGETYTWLYPILIILASFILEDPTTIAVGILISRHEISYELGLVSLILGVFLGDFGLYGVGIGLKKGFFKSTKVYLEPKFFSIAIARFVPGMRTVTFLSAGFSQFPLLKFLCIIFPSAILWTVIILKFTDEIIGTFSSISPWVIWIGGTLVLIVIQRVEKLLKK